MMLKAMFSATALLTALPLAAQTQAVAPADAKIALTRTDDLRCLLLVSELIGTGTAAQKEAGTKAALYFAGKILGREPGLDLTAAAKTEIVAMEKIDRPAGYQRCGAELQLIGVKLQAAGAGLTAMAKGAQ